MGNDFLNTQKATISYEKNELKLNCLPFPITLYTNSNPSNSNTYFLSPRSETVIEIDILNSKISEGICPEVQICEGVFLAKSLVKVENNLAFTTALNPSENPIKIQFIENFNIEPIDLNEVNFIDHP